jgi:hypothetical protein
MEPEPPSQTTPQIESLVAELLKRWYTSFAAESWSERLTFLNELHEQLLEDLGDWELYCAVFPAFIAALIDRLGDSPVASEAQAHIYANSRQEEHRRAAGAWLAANRPAAATN